MKIAIRSDRMCRLYLVLVFFWLSGCYPQTQSFVSQDSLDSESQRESECWQASGISDRNGDGRIDILDCSTTSGPEFPRVEAGSGDVLGWWVTEPFQTTDGRLWIGANAFALSGVDSVQFLVSGMGVTSITEPEYHVARGVRGYWLSIDPAQVSGDFVSVTATVISNGMEYLLELAPKKIQKRGARWDVETFKDGWTYLKPSSDSRLIYVSSTGDDAAAASAKGRGYYLPSDPEIGPDPTNPVGPIVAYGSVAEASKRFRGRNWNGTDSVGGIPNHTYQAPGNRNGYPDWILFRRGDSYTMPVVPTSWGDQVRTLTSMIGNWSENRSAFSYEAGGASGRSEAERAVITAWGPPTDARPAFDLFGVNGNARNFAIVSIETPNAMQHGSSGDGNTADNLLMEDVVARSLGAWGLISMKNASFRRCVFSGSFNGSSHNQGFVLGGTDEVTIEECVFDRNGYKEDPDDATTWTGGVVAGSLLPAGTGVQPRRTYFDRNLYMSSYDSLTLRGNIISRGGGGSSVQMREGGLAERNLFIWNETALGMSHPQSDPARHKGSLVKDNVVLHDDHLLPPGGWGAGLIAGGADDDLAVLDGNIVAHFHRGNNGEQSLGVYGKSYYSDSQPASKLMRGIIKDNAVYREFGGIGINVPSTIPEYGVLDADVTGNAVSTSGRMSVQSDSSKPVDYVYTGNNFHSTTGSGLFKWGTTDGTFLQWQSAGFDTDGIFTNDFAAFKAAAGWTAPERDIVSYMQSVDPTYVVNEDVYVDEESAVKQAVRQKVWEVLMNWTAWPGAMSEAQAKLTARRYHAFITFIQRAKENRKGAWDTRWTAEAVNNYIREGFGKTN